MNVSDLFLCSGNEIGFKFVHHKYGMYSLIFSCGESFQHYRLTYTAAGSKMSVRFLCCAVYLFWNTYWFNIWAKAQSE